MQYILFCSGEDSGDILGEPFVKMAIDAGFDACGVGGYRMQKVGLKSIADFEELPVSGFGDILPNFFKLKKTFKKLIKLLKSEDCLGFIAIDYPGFNIKLSILAKKFNKKVLYIAPPQVWAWKKSRAKKLKDIDLAVLFEFEKKAYESFGIHAELIEHPFKNFLKKTKTESEIILLPGSRKLQAIRNLRFYLNVLSNIKIPIKIVASRESLVLEFENLIKKMDLNFIDKTSIFICPKSVEERVLLFQKAKYAIVSPGTASLEIALSGCPQVVVTVPDKITYLLGSLFLHISYFSMPNILLSKKVIDEYICSPWRLNNYKFKILNSIEKINKAISLDIADKLIKEIKCGKLASEFFRKFLASNSHKSRRFIR